MSTDAKQDYDKMSWLYNAFYGDVSGSQLRTLEFVENHRELLGQYYKSSAKVLDCACGNGVQATALALNGYSVTATDISGEMIKLADELAQKHGVRLETAVKAWNELPGLYKGQFDIIFCTGNSIVHSSDAAAREDNISSLSEILRPGGTLVIETRNWDKLVAEHKQFTVYNRMSYKGKDYIPLYYWQLNGMESAAEVRILFQEVGGDNHVTLYESSLRFTPFTHESLLGIMKNHDLTIVKDTFEENSDWYVIYASMA